jgi:TRAP-type C4-dicarboxylate transport system permease small subunit
MTRPAGGPCRTERRFIPGRAPAPSALSAVQGCLSLRQEFGDGMETSFKQGNPKGHKKEGRGSFWASLGTRLIGFLDGFNLFLFIVLIILATAQVLFRYVIQYPLPWTEELARFTLVWVTFLGAASVTRRKLHLAVDFFVSKLPLRASRAISFFFYLLILIFLGTALWGAMVMMEESIPVFAGSIPWLSMMYLYLGGVIGLSFMMVYVLLHFYRDLRAFGENGRSPSGS